jgi:hypothetical protein
MPATRRSLNSGSVSFRSSITLRRSDE